jgi:hypothetical protein
MAVCRQARKRRLVAPGLPRPSVGAGAHIERAPGVSRPPRSTSPDDKGVNALLNRRHRRLALNTTCDQRVPGHGYQAITRIFDLDRQPDYEITVVLEAYGAAGGAGMSKRILVVEGTS